MPFVLDASITACWALWDENHPVAEFARTHLLHEEAVVPALWWFEIRNLLIVNERRGRLLETDSSRFLRELDRLGIVQDQAPEGSRVLDLARTHRLSVYDSSYLELALRKRARLATLDKALALAAEREGVSLVGPG